MAISLERALALVPHAAEIVDLDGIIRYVNAAFERLTGYTRDEAIGKVALELLRTSAHAEGVHLDIIERLRHGEPWTGPLQMRHKDGSVIHLEQTITPVLDDAGQMEAFFTVRRDVTERVLAERAVRDSEELYRQVFQNNRAIKLLVDPSTGAIEDANAAAAQFYGYPVSVLRSMRITDINALPESEIAAELRQAESEERTYFRFPHRLASGEIRRVEVFSGPVSYRGRTLLFSIIHDVTEREHAESELSRSEARFRALLQKLPVGVVVHRNGVVVYGNQAVASMLGYESPEQVADLRVLDHVEGSFDGAPREVLRPLGDVGAIPIRHERLRRRDGSLIEAEIRSLPIDFDGSPAVMALVVDVSERDRLEDQLRGAQRMEAVGRLAGGVAHDFNNLLFVILNVASLLSKRLPEGSPLRADVDQIDAAGRRAAELTRQLLLFSRGAETATNAVDLNTVVSEIARLLRGTLGEHVGLDVELAEAPTYVRVARPHLEQVLVNLAVNARDAMPSGGTITLYTARTTVLAQDYVRLTVRDEGIGMTPSVAEHAFEPFFTTKDHGRGTGLGLAITYGIVQKSGGSIAIQTAPGEGTTFTILLPESPPPGRTSEPPRSFGSAGSGEVILVVEDEDAVRDTLVRILSGQGYRVLCASGAAEAEKVAGNEAHIDLLLTDVIMPRVSGPALAVQLRAVRPRLRVLYMSGYTGDSLSDRGVAESEVLNKPFDADLLLARVRAALGGRG